jgi:hypothetical protein
LHEDVRSFVMKNSLIIIRMRDASDIICGDNVTDILYSIFYAENRAVCKIMWISVLQSKWETDGNIMEMYVHCMLEI